MDSVETAGLSGCSRSSAGEQTEGTRGCFHTKQNVWNMNHLRWVTGGWWPTLLLWLLLSWSLKKSWAKGLPGCSNTMWSFSRASENICRVSVAAPTDTYRYSCSCVHRRNELVYHSPEPSPTSRHLKHFETKQSKDTASFLDHLLSSFVLIALSSCSQKCWDVTWGDGTR